jgi:ABC-type phosphate transport system auxiliary subunit
MAKSLRALQLEVAAYEAEQQQLKNELAQLRTTVARQKVYPIDLSLAQFIIHNKKLFIITGVH